LGNVPQDIGDTGVTLFAMLPHHFVQNRRCVWTDPIRCRHWRSRPRADPSKNATVSRTANSVHSIRYLKQRFFSVGERVLGLGLTPNT
jgi:hypothetical protein